LEGTTLPTLSKAKLPTSGGGLANLAADMQGLLVSGITPMDYLTTFQRWHTYTSKSGEATFPICGPTVAAFLKTSSRLESGERPKLVWILDHYRKATIGVFDGLRRDEKWTMKLARNWGTVEWDAWDRFIALSKIRLGEWKIIEELAPATLPRAPLANRYNFPNSHLSRSIAHSPLFFSQTLERHVSWIYFHVVEERFSSFKLVRRSSNAPFAKSSRQASSRRF
jgi:hypothetical protein